ncbi:MAG TPA: S46 family peptidase [Longimicrobiales bacterium]
MSSKRIDGPALVLLVFALGGLSACASSPQQPAGVAPRPAAVPAEQTVTTAEALLEPPPAALRVADRVTLTGRELGTMWTFENPPLEYWRERYGFDATPAWLEKVRLASVRYGEICSASFVSPNGLVATNHHCARECIEAVSTEQHDYLVEGFYAASREDELLCPDLFLDQLVEIEDITQRIQAAAPAGADEARIAAAIDSASQAIEGECEATTDFQCQVVSLYHGGQYKLYRYRRYAPVKLVFAPELQAGFFGGDPDNFTYPRYALDVAFVRAYEPGGSTPASTPAYFQWDEDGAREGELVFVTGNPGTTSRLFTVAQVMYERQYRHPFIVRLLRGQRDILQEIARQSPEAERQVRDQLFGIENSLKAFTGQLAGLNDSLLLGRKIRWEREFRQRIEADPALRAQYGDVWDRLARIQARKLELSPRLNANNIEFLPSPHLRLAGLLVRYVRQAALPEAERDEAFRGERLAQIETMLRNPVPIDPEQSARVLALRLDIARQFLPPDDPFIREAFRPGETPEQAARRLTRETRIADAAFRQELLAGGAPAVAAATDPMVRLARQMEDAFARLEPQWSETLAAEQVQRARLGRALFAAYGTQVPPDATFTLRITDGVVARYPYNGTFAPPHTSIFGLYARASEFGNEMPWTLPESFAERREHVDMSTPLDFVTTNDITGGNSGSPMIDRDARVVGLVFDSNIEGLPYVFLYGVPEAGRAVGVHSAGILEALRNVYRADALVRELTTH